LPENTSFLPEAGPPARPPETPPEPRPETAPEQSPAPGHAADGHAADGHAAAPAHAVAPAPAEMRAPGLSGGVRVLVQPEDGPHPVIGLIAAARHSILIKQFSFDHPAILEAVIAAHRAGRNVRVMLNPHRSSGDRANDATEAALRAEGVAVAWSSPRFAVTHEKSTVIDDTLALIATFNLSEKYFSLTRDYGLVVSDQAAIAEIRACFEADWNHVPFHPPAGSSLLWSTANSRPVMSGFIDAARETLDIQHPKFVDATILDRIADAHARGVKVRVLCGGRHGISEWDVLDTFSALRILYRLNVRVHKQKNLRLHAKLLIADDRRALVGSMNIDRSAFDLRRELGLVVSDPAAVRRLRGIFADDWEESRHYDAPDPLLAHTRTEDDFPPDPDLMHE
jgi:phosphatidylserine/phosphatidylglycerophosphate/cardiolipin synthase-like enzyme